MEELQKYLEVIPSSDRLSQNLCIRLARLLILADQIGYIVLEAGERRRLWSILGGNQLEKALLFGFCLTSEGSSPAGRAWLEQKFGQIWGFRFQIT